MLSEIINCFRKRGGFRYLLIMKKILVIVFLLASFFLANFSLATNSWGLDDVVNNKPKLKEAFSTEEVNKGKPGYEYIFARSGVLIGSILSFIAVVFMILIIYSGILWMTARGNEQQVEKAKNLIIQAIIGLIIVLSAYVITSFIGSVFDGSSSIVSSE